MGMPFKAGIRCNFGSSQHSLETGRKIKSCKWRPLDALLGRSRKCKSRSQERDSSQRQFGSSSHMSLPLDSARTSMSPRLAGALFKENSLVQCIIYLDSYTQNV